MLTKPKYDCNNLLMGLVWILFGSSLSENQLHFVSDKYFYTKVWAKLQYYFCNFTKEKKLV